MNYTATTDAESYDLCKTKQKMDSVKGNLNGTQPKYYEKPIKQEQKPIQTSITKKTPIPKNDETHDLIPFILVVEHICLKNIHISDSIMLKSMWQIWNILERKSLHMIRI